MSFNLSAVAVRERAVTLFFILLMTAAGAYAFFMLGRAEDPSFTIKTLTVTTVWTKKPCAAGLSASAASCLLSISRSTTSG